LAQSTALPGGTAARGPTRPPQHPTARALARSSLKSSNRRINSASFPHKLRDNFRNNSAPKLPKGRVRKMGSLAHQVRNTLRQRVLRNLTHKVRNNLAQKGRSNLRRKFRNIEVCEIGKLPKETSVLPTTPMMMPRHLRGLAKKRRRKRIPILVGIFLGIPASRSSQFQLRVIAKGH
jgi:hypothetical protein